MTLMFPHRKLTAEETRELVAAGFAVPSSGVLDTRDLCAAVNRGILPESIIPAECSEPLGYAIAEALVLLGEALEELDQGRERGRVRLQVARDKIRAAVQWIPDAELLGRFASDARAMARQVEDLAAIPAGRVRCSLVEVEAPLRRRERRPVPPKEPPRYPDDPAKPGERGHTSACRPGCPPHSDEGPG